MSKDKQPPPEPGTVEDPELGVPGPAEEMPFNDAEEEFETAVNDDNLYDEEDEEYEEEEGDDGAR